MASIFESEAVQNLKEKLGAEVWINLLENCFERVCMDIVVMALPEKLRKTCLADSRYRESKEGDVAMLFNAYVCEAMNIPIPIRKEEK